MNRDVKIGLAIGLLLLVGLFVWFAWKASRGVPQVADVPKKEAEKVIGEPDKTSNTGDLTSKDYFGTDGDANTNPNAGGNTASVEVGKGNATAPKEDLTEEAKKYRDILKAKGSDTTFTDKGTATVATAGDTGTATPATYVVKKGDYLSTISKQVYGSSRYWEKIAQANNIDAKGLKVGQTLKIPPLSADEKGKISVKPAAVAGGSTPPATGEQIHKVVKGDTLAAISKKYFGDTKHVKAIMEANKLDNEHMLRVGSSLVIPKSGSAAGTAVASTTDVVPTPAPAASDAKKEYVVKEGDTLTTIAKKFYGSSKYYLLIMQANNLDDSRSVRIGTKLIIPAKPETVTTSAGASGTAAVPTPTSTVATGEKQYTVREGDTFAIIAASELGSSLYSNDVMKRNKMSEADTLKPGQVIILPAPGTLRVLSSVTRDE